MRAVNAGEVRNVILEMFADSFRANGMDPSDVGDDSDLMSLGIIDSLGVVQMIGAIEDLAGGEIDLEELDFEDMTVIGKFAAYVEAYTSEHAGSG